MENYEQKYKEALERARKLGTREMPIDPMCSIQEQIFPELVESEDEKIRKGLLALLKELVELGGVAQDTWSLKECQQYISWLEKQGRQDNVWHVEQGFVIKDPENYFKEVCATAPIEIEKKPAWSEEDERIYQSILDDTVQENQLDSNQFVWLKSIKDKVQIQPKQEWSEDDSWMLNVCCNAIDSYKEPVDKYLVKKWLKSLKDRIQPQPKPKQEWSEEDEKMLKSCITILEQTSDVRNEWPLNKQEVDWLKSIKPRWKPSEQNIKDLNWCADLVEDKMGVGFHRLQVFIDELKNFES